MNPFEMVIGIVLIVTIGSVVRAKYGVRRDNKGNEFYAPPADTGETKALQAEIRALKDRIQVLERIATDQNRAVTLDEEIEKLRDRSKI
jgi:hypothetical protein